MCVQITFTRKLSFFKISLSINGQLWCESRKLVQVEPQCWQPTHWEEAVSLSTRGLLAAFVYSVLLQVWSLDDQRQNHLGRQFKVQTPRAAPRPKDSNILGGSAGLHNLNKPLLCLLELETLSLASQVTMIAQNNF